VLEEVGLGGGGVGREGDGSGETEGGEFGVGAI